MMRKNFVTAVIMIVAFFALFGLGLLGWKAFHGPSQPMTPLAKLAQVARNARYWTDEGSVALPLHAFKAGQLFQWKQFAQNTMHISTDGIIFRICVMFNEAGTEIRGVDIVWREGRKCASFPWHLNEDETVDFVEKTVPLLGDHVVTRVNSLIRELDVIQLEAQKIEKETEAGIIEAHAQMQAMDEEAKRPRSEAEEALDHAERLRELDKLWN